MPINSFGATAASDKNIMSDVAIANFQRLLQEQGYLYFEEIPDGFDYLAFAQKFGSLIPHKYNGEYTANFMFMKYNSSSLQTSFVNAQD